MTARRNAVFEVWTAMWGWKDGARPNEYLFATSKEACKKLLDEQVSIARKVLIRLNVARNQKTADKHISTATPKVVDLFDTDTRPEVREAIAGIQRYGYVIWTNPPYLKMLAAADIDATVHP